MKLKTREKPSHLISVPKTKFLTTGLSSATRLGSTVTCSAPTESTQISVGGAKALPTISPPSHDPPSERPRPLSAWPWPYVAWPFHLPWGGATLSWAAQPTRLRVLIKKNSYFSVGGGLTVCPLPPFFFLPSARHGLP